VTSLEAKLEAEYREKVELLKMMGELKAEVAALRTKLELMTMRGNH
jgi:predicted nuclease with TOPRIM domain